MSVVDLFWHLMGFAAPAFALAPAMVLASRVFGHRSARSPSWMVQTAINFAVCLAVLAAGLVLTGHDGRMATYAALVLASAACQTWMARRR